MPNIKQNGDGSQGWESTSSPEGGYLPVSIAYVASTVDTYFFTADRNYVVKGIRGKPSVAGTGGACTVQIRKVPSGTAITSGTVVHSGTYNIVGTVDTNQTLTLSTTATDLAMVAGDSLAYDLTGTATSAVGAITVILAPA